MRNKAKLLPHIVNWKFVSLSVIMSLLISFGVTMAEEAAIPEKDLIPDYCSLSPQEISSLEDKAITGDGRTAVLLSAYYSLCSYNPKVNVFWTQIGAENGDKGAQSSYAATMSMSPDDYGVPRKYVSNFNRWQKRIAYWVKAAQSQEDKKDCKQKESFVLEDKALAGDGRAAMRLYFFNKGKTEEELYWLQISAQNGDPEAFMYLILEMKDPVRRAKWFGVAADDKKMNELFDKRIQYWEKKLAKVKEQEEKERLELLKLESSGK